MDRRLRLGVCVAPTRGTNLYREESLLKPALLYADEVKLYSPKTALYSALTEFGELDSLEQFMAIAKMAEPIGLKVDLSQLETRMNGYRLLKASGRLTREQRNAVAKLEGILETPSAQKLRDGFDNLAIDSGAKKLRELAMTSDILDIQSYSSPDNILDEWLGSILVSTMMGQEALLLDASTSALLKSLQDLLRSTYDGSQRIRKAAAVAGDLFQRLPMFPEASLDEIMDIRTELGPHIAPFRQAVDVLAKRVSCQHWEAGFEAEVERLAKECFDEPVKEIEEVCKTSTGLRRMLKAAAAHTSWTQILGCLVADAVALPNLLVQFFGIGGVDGVPSSVVGILKSVIQSVPHARRALLRWKEDRREVTENRLYFYYRLRQRLG